ncbi:MAG: O-antigen ligase family protein [Thiothrix litoralis]|jgi:O-antigen ligase
MNQTTNISFPQWLVFGLACLLLVFAPLIRAGNTGFALLVMQLLGLGILLVLGWWGLYRHRFPTAVWWFLIGSIGLVGLYLVPIPESLWRALPGRALYVDVYDWLGESGQRDLYLAVSLIPANTAYSLMALLPPLGIFLAVGCLDKRQLVSVVYLFLGVAALQAGIGLTQYSAGFSDSASGSYPNRDHFSAFMAMAFPLAFGLAAYHVGRHTKHHEADTGVLEHKLNRVLVFASLTLLLLLAGIFSRSRAGVALMILGILLSSLMFARHIGGKRSASLMATLSTIGGGIAASIGLIPVLNRFMQANPADDLRWYLFDTSLRGIQQFFPFGSGPGTFADIYRALQPLGQTGGFVNNAHNDYLELLFDTGLVGGVIIVGMLLLYLYGWWQLRQQAWEQTRFLKAGAGIGMLLVLLHAYVDFNFHIPANALFFAFLAGLFLRVERKR